MWHLQVTSLTARLYRDGTSYDNYDPYVATAQVELMGDGTCFMHTMLRTEGDGSLTKRQFLRLGEILYKQYGITKVLAIRKGKMVEYDTVKALKRIKDESTTTDSSQEN